MIKKLKANSVQIIEVMIMLIAFLLPYILNIPSWFTVKL